MNRSTKPLALVGGIGYGILLVRAAFSGTSRPVDSSELYHANAAAPHLILRIREGVSPYSAIGELKGVTIYRMRQ